MGLVVPFVSFALILRSWRQIGWRAEGSWWGFAVLAGAAALMWLHQEMLFVVMVHKDWLLQLPPLPLIAVMYGAGIVLLFGGKRLLRAAWFGVVFLWMVIPVPQTFTRAIDLPLQHASASVARAFAHALGQPLAQDKLRLMFTPDFGMFIAPGCNGIRGAITLGLAAVVVSYMYRFRWFVYAPVVAGAVLLGYLFNFLRLCLLVVYYKIALPYPWLQERARGADFWIGGVLFACALAVFFAVANRLRNDPADVHPEVVERETVSEPPSYRTPATPLLLRVAALLALAAIFGFDAYDTRVAAAKVLAAAPHSVALPQQLGRYVLLRTWDDTLTGGTIVYSWSEYAVPGENGPHVALGISPVLGIHDAEVCHLARGENPVFHGQVKARSSASDLDLTVASYNDGVKQWIEASTVCEADDCRQFSQSSQHVTLVYAQPHRTAPLTSNTTRPVPVLIRLESTDTTSPDSAIRPMLVARLQDFLGGFDLVAATQPYGLRPAS